MRSFSTLLFVVLGLVGACPARSAVVLFDQKSAPAGFVSLSSYVNTPTNTLTMMAPLEISGQRFTHWTINGARPNDFTGRALNPVPLTIYEDTYAVAHYLPAEQDSDMDEVPDWYEINLCGTLAIAQGDDTDADGYNLETEFQLDYHPLLTQQPVTGGVSLRTSDTLLLILDPSLFVYQERSVPAGLISERQLVVASNTVVTTVTPPWETLAQTFAFWEVNGQRVCDAFGIAISPCRITVRSNVTAIARHVPTADDLNASGIPDWYEWRYLGSLSNAPNSDADGDGLPLAQEYRLDYCPVLSNSILGGGISLRTSELIAIVPSNYWPVLVHSDPPGLIESQESAVPEGTVVTTPNLHGEILGRSFACWSRNGQFQAGPFGIALSRVTCTVTNTTDLVAHYVPTEADEDGDGLPDWYEWQMTGTLQHGVNDDLDGDGLTLGQEYNLEMSPVISSTVASGGVSMRLSSLEAVNLQPFERLKYGLVDGILTEVFTEWPNQPTSGWILGTNVSPVLCDWDGDDDLDLFAFYFGGLRVFENVGTPHNPSWTERTSLFGSWVSMLSNLGRPAAAAGDWNGDGGMDLVIGGDTGTLRLLASPGHFLAGQPTPASALALNVGSSQALPALGQFSPTSPADLLVLTADGMTRRYTNNGALPPYFTFQENALGQPVPSARSIQYALVNGDTLLDVLVSDDDGRIWEFIGQSGGGFTLMSKVWAGSGDGFAHGLAVGSGDLDGDGDTDAIVGTAQGALVYLRDPRLGPPTGLKAGVGADSVELTWDPDRSSRIKSYSVYRTSGLSQPFGMLSVPGAVLLPWYLDEHLAAGSTLFYNVHAITMTYLPGNSVPIVLEGPPSDTVNATIGTVGLQIATRYGKPGGPLIVPLYISNTRAMSADFEVRIAYDNSLLTPVAVHRTHVTGNVTITDTGSANTGLWVVQGAGGSMATGAKTLFLLEFQVVGTAVIGQSSPLTVAFARLEDVHGQPLGVANRNGLAKARNEYMWGDVNGDGAPTAADVDRLKVLMKRGVIPTADEISAGDLTGDDELDADDLVLLMRYLDGKPLGR